MLTIMNLTIDIGDITIDGGMLGYFMINYVKLLRANPILKCKHFWEW